jgi:hypothetical protein
MDMVFVFGSSLAGGHGTGAALYAAKAYGAVRGVGEGPTGQAYAIPTKDEKLRVRDLGDVCKSVEAFLGYAATVGKDRTFLLTPVGCGLAGFDAADMWAFLKSKGVSNNVVFSAHWANDHAL